MCINKGCIYFSVELINRLLNDNDYPVLAMTILVDIYYTLWDIRTINYNSKGNIYYKVYS